MSIITLTTDFGTGSPYVAAMKGVILSINPAATLVDLSHEVPPQDIRRGALLLEDTARWFPPGTIHVAVVDPGVGTGRALVYARIGAQQYLAPDNGLLSRVSRGEPPERVIRLAERAYWLPQVSATFHGRDILAPAAAHLSLGLDPARLGPPHGSLTRLDWPEPSLSANLIEGEVLFVDSFGNLISNVRAETLAGLPDRAGVTVTCGGAIVHGIGRTYGEASQGQLVALVGSAGRLEIALVGGNAAKRLGVGAAAAVTVRG